MKLLSAALVAVGLMTVTHMNAKLDADKIPGTYISEAFGAVSPDTKEPDIRSELLVLHSDNTGARYISTSIGSFASSQNANGIALTPSYGTWEIDCKDDTVKAVFFDYFNLAPCSSCANRECSENPSCLCETVGQGENETLVCAPADQQVWVEYDRITYTIRFSDVKDCKYQRAVANQQLIGILQSSCQKSADPANFSEFICEPTLDTFNNPFLALQSLDYLTTKRYLDAIFLPPDGSPSVRNGIIYHRVNVKKNFGFPPAPSL